MPEVMFAGPDITATLKPTEGDAAGVPTTLKTIAIAGDTTLLPLLKEHNVRYTAQRPFSCDGGSMLLMGLLTVNLVVCSLNRLPVSLRLYRMRPEPDRPGLYDELPPDVHERYRAALMAWSAEQSARRE